jgi:hypothetical protein
MSNTSPLAVAAYLQAPIASEQEAVAFIHALHEEGRLFHFDDSPETIINVSSGASIFTAAEVPFVRQRVREMRVIEGFDPFDVAIALGE